MYLYYEIDNISSLGNYDYIALISSFYSMIEPKFNCHKCLSGKGKYERLQGEKKEIMIQKNRKIKGCFDLTRDKPRYPTEHINYFGCIGRYRVSNFDYIMQLHSVYKKGLSPFGGNLVDAPSKIVEVCNLLDNLIAKEQENQQG